MAFSLHYTPVILVKRLSNPQSATVQASNLKALYTAGKGSVGGTGLP